MKTIQLTQGQFAMVDDEDYDFLMQWKWRYLGTMNGKRRTGYASRNQWGKEVQRSVYMHRVIMSITERKIQIDHIDHNGLNNCRSNLRVCTRSQNACNVMVRKNSKSGLKGVFFNEPSNTYYAYISYKGRSKYLGCYKTPEEAHAEYCKCGKEIHGEYFNSGLLQRVK